MPFYAGTARIPTGSGALGLHGGAASPNGPFRWTRRRGNRSFVVFGMRKRIPFFPDEPRKRTAASGKVGGVSGNAWSDGHRAGDPVPGDESEVVFF